MKLITGRRLQAYFLEHAMRDGPAHRYRVTKPLHVFKKVFVPVSSQHSTLGLYIGDKRYVLSSGIANLIIPTGALVVIDATVFTSQAQMHAPTCNWSVTERKMRASVAKVHSVVRTSSKEQVAWGVSGYARSFNYTPGKLVRPTEPFDMSHNQCSSGIHFFLNLPDARAWIF